MTPVDRTSPADHDTIAAAVIEIATQPDPDGADGITFDASSVRTRTIREEGLYAGVRVMFAAELATARIKVSLDINFGDPVTLGPRPVQSPSVRPGSAPVTVLGYPLETVLAAKICTAIALGDANSRMKDYADIWTLTGRHAFERQAVSQALVVSSGSS
ncbi:nucleotidyl transferase AbiEii/AbiGii toxin family protein [Kineococcus arenarius]|uniref:nucleotidyl transferase AbiEii/AbiGii toxin family protein n=1 Tax=Kineococcus sp. SYSU DK007 TaxID=3383128 RepID=UPI003D7DBF53